MEKKPNLSKNNESAPAAKPRFNLSKYKGPEETAVANQPKKKKLWLWILIALIAALAIAGIICLLVCRNSCSSVTDTPAAAGTPPVVVPVPDPPTAAPDPVATPPANVPAATTAVPYVAGTFYKVYLFPFGKAAYSQPDAELDKLITVLNENPSVKIRIYAYTDNVGSAAYNRTLSQNRAKAIYSYLISKGISSSRLAYEGKGVSTKYDNDSQNRRAEIVLSQ
jgi:outer membrane protein OmpA-like peptidoglycan-associated protein